MSGELSFEEQWADVVPIPQNDGPNPVVKIAYTSQFTKYMDLFRGVVAKGEYSERVLELTEELLEQNAANYTIWQYRRECLRRLNFDLNEELDYMDAFSRDNPKNYQIWHHRRTIVEWLGNGERELKFCASVFDVDAKNYHAWAHRQWALHTFNLWENELSFIEECLTADIRNNSAWNQRWFYVHSGPEMLTAAVLQREVAFTLASLQRVSLNESAWNYLRGLYKTHREEVGAEIKAECERIVQESSSQNGAQGNVFAMGLLADICEMEATTLLAGSTTDSDASHAHGASLPTPPSSSSASSALPAPATATGTIIDTTASVSTAAISHALQLLRTAEGLCVKLVAFDQIRAKSWTRRALALRQRIALAAPLRE